MTRVERPTTVYDYDESQASISSWADRTFGPAGTNMSVARRAHQEMKELLGELAADDGNQKAAGEMADVVCILFRLADRMGFDLLDEVDKKMRINRAREWNLDGKGQGYHKK